MANRITFPLKYKFLLVILFILFSGLGIFFYLAQKTFSEDKKLFVMDHNLTLLQATTAEIKMELKERLEDLQSLIPRVYQEPNGKANAFDGASASLENELLGMAFYRTGADGKFVPASQYPNAALLNSRKFPANLLTMINEKHPLALDTFQQAEGVQLLNRSVHLGANGDAAVLTFIISGTILNNDSKNILIVVDLLQDFLRKRLGAAEMAEVFLMFGNGTLLSHPSEKLTVDYASVPFPHPVVERMKSKRFARESMELNVNGEDYLCNLSETGFKDVMAVSQTQKRQAFLALHTLLQRSAWLALLILSGSALVSIFFASGLTSNIRKLQEASERIGKGELDLQIAIRSRDEIRTVGDSFQHMAQRLKSLIAESAQKAVMEEELETARLVQSTLLTLPRLNSEAIELVSHYSPATQCGGDYWDASLVDNLLTVFIGDATGHGAPAAIVTAVAKSCFATLTSIYQGQPMPPDELLTRLNKIIFDSCQGKLLMTMSIVQIDLGTGDVRFANAGHEPPFLLRSNPVNSKEAAADKKKSKVDNLFVRGERLGFSPETTYECETAKIEIGDVLFLYTDGVTEAHNEDMAEWGERSLKKTLADGGVRPLSMIRKQVITAVEEHMGERPPDDDITFVLFSWKKALGAAGAKPKRGKVASARRAALPKAAAAAEDEEEKRDAVLYGRDPEDGNSEAA